MSYPRQNVERRRCSEQRNIPLDLDLDLGNQQSPLSGSVTMTGCPCPLFPMIVIWVLLITALCKDCSVI